jgi:hypothetical protein
VAGLARYPLVPVVTRDLPVLIVRGSFVDLALSARQRIHHT